MLSSISLPEPHIYGTYMSGILSIYLLAKTEEVYFPKQEKGEKVKVPQSSQPLRQCNERLNCCGAACSLSRLKQIKDPVRRLQWHLVVRLQIATEYILKNIKRFVEVCHSNCSPAETTIIPLFILALCDLRLNLNVRHLFHFNDSSYGKAITSTVKHCKTSLIVWL